MTADVWVHQRAKGHRFSSDDLVTAWTALQVQPSPVRILDLGCGLGSVLLHLAWSAPRSTLVGVEAQAMSFDLARRNIAHNGLGDRVKVHLGDLRDGVVMAAVGGPFDLVTGTPPYFPVDAATDATDEQRSYARVEHRGGVEAYIDAAAPRLTSDGWLVVCSDADATARVERAAAGAGLIVGRRDVVIPRADRPALFTVWALRAGALEGPAIENVLTLRDEAGHRTDDAKMLRAFSGLREAEPTAN